MLLSLKVHNYALINELYIEFHKGLNIVTGETGAGKSILLGALGLILGKRADSSVLSNQEKKCVIEAEFNVENYKLEPLFISNDIDYDNHVIIRREILISGKSRAFINDTPVNLNILQSISLLLVDIHSQHQNLLLNKQSYILNIIDAFSQLNSTLTEYKNIYSGYCELEGRYKKQLEEFNRVREEMDLISHRVEELEKANLQEGEIEHLEQEIYQQEHAGELKTILHETTSMLGTEDSGVLDLVANIENKITKVGKVLTDGHNLIERIQSAKIELKDIEQALLNLFESMEFDPKYHEKIKSRLDLLNGLLMKYRVNEIQALIAVQKEQKEKLSIAVDGEYELNNLKKELESLFKVLDQKANELTVKRESSFHSLQNQITELLQDMGMEYSKVSFLNEKQELSASGRDSISFLFSANKNHPVQDISKIASGGELSRLMLTVKALLSGSNGMPTLILDEIDTGVSGEIADKVGNILKNMSSSTQIINITHLPQVASKGETHFLVYKDHEQSTTQTMVRKLTETERLQEIAKMLSGEQITEAALENARELLKN
jgi:DNA repair protein RecN (Recombination protein N)